MSRDQFFKDNRLPFAECRFTRESSEVFKPHLHHSFCIGASEDGVLNFRAGDQEVLLRPGALALINPEAIHACNPLKGHKRSFYMLYLDYDWCLKIQQSLWQNSSFIPVDCIVAKDTALYDVFIETMTCLMTENYLLEKEQKLAELSIAVFTRCCLPSLPCSADSSNTIALKRWLAEDLEMEKTLTDFAASLNVNPYTLLRSFHKMYGVTPHAFRMNCRIESARGLLQNGCEIGDVAQRCGFFDQSHFHRYFRAMTSVTPRQYQRNFVE